MTLELVESAYLLRALLGFRELVAPAGCAARHAHRRRLWRLHERAGRRYWRRRAAYLAQGGAPW